MQPGVGHYGVFNGSRFRAEIAPRIADFVISNNGNDQSGGKRAVKDASAEASTPDSSARTGAPAASELAKAVKMPAGGE